MIYAGRRCNRGEQMLYEILTKAEIDAAIEQLYGWTVLISRDQPALGNHGYFLDLIQSLSL